MKKLTEEEIIQLDKMIKSQIDKNGKFQMPDIFKQRAEEMEELLRRNPPPEKFLRKDVSKPKF